MELVCTLYQNICSGTSGECKNPPFLFRRSFDYAQDKSRVKYQVPNVRDWGFRGLKPKGDAAVPRLYERAGEGGRN